MSTKHTPSAGALPNASIDFDKVHAAARDGRKDIYKGAVSKQRDEPAPEAGESDSKVASEVLASPPAAER